MKMATKQKYFIFIARLCVGIPQELAYDRRYLKGYLESDSKQRNVTHREQVVQPS